MEEDLFSHSGSRGGRGRGRGDNLFVWTIALLLLVGLAAVVWIASYYVFEHPEEPVNYALLDRLGQIEPPQRFELTKAPRGEFLTAREAFERFSSLPAFEIANRNAEFVRNYIRNYSSLDGRLPYLVGTYHVWESYTLGEDDTVTSGVVVLAQSADFPGVLVEHLYPTGKDAAATLRRMMRTGTAIELKKTLDLAAILQVTKLRDGRLLLTVMPLLYGSYAMGDGAPAVGLEPPLRLHLDAGWPVIKEMEIEAAEKAHRLYLREHGLSAPEADTPALAPVVPTVPRMTPPPVPAGLNPDATPAPSTDAPVAPSSSPPPSAPAIPVAPAVPAIPRATAVASPSPAPASAVPMATATPVATPQAPSTPTPTPAPALPSAATRRLGPGGVPLKPFLPPGSQPSTLPAAAPAAQAAATPMPPPSSAWRLYPPGRMPRGRLVEVGEAARLADGGMRGERLYLSGNFVVTASSSGKAVLRSHSGLHIGLPGLSRQTRIVVEFPEQSMVPAVGSQFGRGAQRPFQILSVETGADGVVNIYAREITSP